MNRSKSLTLTLTLWISLTVCPQAECGQNGKEEAGVTIALTKLDVNDTTLELSYKIKNRSDHDVWLCDSLSPEYPSVYEYFLDKDGKTLVLRRRFALPMREELTMKYPPLISRYVRLRSGQEKAESISLAVPVQPYRISTGESAYAEYAGRLALEIGFYDENLPELILQIVELAEKLNCDLDVGAGDLIKISDRFFGGWVIAQAFKHILGFSESVTSGGDEVKFQYMGQVLNGEQVLRLEVDGVHIPYGSAPAAEEPANDEVEDTPITIALTKLDVNDQKLELSYKIENGSNHDVWVCDSVANAYGSGRADFEVYLAEDAQTLVIRKRLDISPDPDILWYSIPVGRYVRLRPGQERAETLSLAVPVRPSLVYINERANAESTRRLVLEIGFYNEDLPGMIRSIIEVVERLGCANVELKDYESDIMRHYFKGLLIKGRFGGLEYFDESHQDVSEQFLTAYTDQLLGEQVLRIVVDGVFIPYEE